MIGENLLRYKKDKIITFVDVETANLALNECWNLPWEIAFIKTNGHEIIDKYVTYINWSPSLNISKDAARITGYNEQLVKETGKNPLEVANLSYKLLTECDFVCGHNILNFDYYVINSWFRKVGLKIYNFVPKIIDTNCLLKGIELNNKYKHNDDLVEYQYKMNEIIKKGVKTNLSYACRKYGIEIDESKHHQALYDLEINFKVFKKIMWEQEI